MLFIQHCDVKSYTYTAEAAFIKYSDMVFALAYSRCNANYSDAQDTASEVFYRLVRRKPILESEEHLKAWLIKVTINCSKSQTVNAWSRNTCEFSEFITESETNEEDSTVYMAVMTLPEKIRTAIHLFYYEDMSVENISKAMNANGNTVKSWLKRGRERLRIILNEDIH